MRTSKLYRSSQTTIKKIEGLECVNTPQLCCSLQYTLTKLQKYLAQIQALSMTHDYSCLFSKTCKALICLPQIHKPNDPRISRTRGNPGVCVCVCVSGTHHYSLTHTTEEHSEVHDPDGPPSALVVCSILKVLTADKTENTQISTLRTQ